MYISTDVTFVKNKPYFITPYLKGELHTLKDKESNFSPSELSKSGPHKSHLSKSGYQFFNLSQTFHHRIRPNLNPKPRCLKLNLNLSQVQSHP